MAASRRWGDPYAKLLQGPTWEEVRPRVCRTLGRSHKAAAELENLGRPLDDAYRRTANDLPTNSAAAIERAGRRDVLKLTPLDKLDEPASLVDLRGEARFWRIGPKAVYGALTDLARQRINIPRIERNWDDLLRMAGSLKMGAVSASELIRALQGGGRPSTLGRALGELGRVAETLYLLNYLDDEAYRRRILTQLNRGESRHAVARAIFHGQRGELRQRYREGQEDQLGALGRVVNVVVLWNTRYLDAALAQVRASGMVNQPEDVERLSPLRLDHVNVFGRYVFNLKKSIRQGKLRPLSDPEKPDDLAA